MGPDSFHGSSGGFKACKKGNTGRQEEEERDEKC